MVSEVVASVLFVSTPGSLELVVVAAAVCVSHLELLLQASCIPIATRLPLRKCLVLGHSVDVFFSVPINAIHDELKAATTMAPQVLDICDSFDSYDTIATSLFRENTPVLGA